MWLLKKLRPDHQTIANFRRDNVSARRQVCRAFTLLCKQRDVFGGELVAVDGSKFKAVNAKERNFKPDNLQRLIAQIDERVDRYLPDLDQVDTDDDEGTPSSGAVAALQDKIARLRERKLLYQRLQARLVARGEEHLSLTDPESRMMILGKGRGTEVCYNVQTAVDAKHTLIVANDVTNDPGDRDWLSPMALQAQAVLGGAFKVVADVGYYHGHEVKTCVEAGITPYVARPVTSANRKLGLFSKDDFVYAADTDTYRCPAGAVVTYRFSTVELGRAIRYDATSTCGRCPRKAHCTRGKEGRRITRWVDEHLLEDMARRVRRRPDVMKQRKHVVEHPFGTMKRWMDAGYVLMRGLDNVRGECSLTVLAYTLKRVFTMVGVPTMVAALKQRDNVANERQGQWEQGQVERKLRVRPDLTGF